MTIRLLAKHSIYAANTIVTLDAATEASLIAAKLATTDTTGGVAYVPPPPPPPNLYPALAEADAAGNLLGLTIPGINRTLQMPEAVPLPMWRAAMGRLRNNLILPNGAANPKIAFVGSSSYAGYGAGSTVYNSNTGLTAGSREKSIVPKLAAMFNTYFAPVQANAFSGPNGEFTGTRAAFVASGPRFVLAGTGWTMDDPGRSNTPPTHGLLAVRTS